jgi:hypothetical protein
MPDSKSYLSVHVGQWTNRKLVAIGLRKTISIVVNQIYSFILLFYNSSMVLQPFVGPWPLLQFRNLIYTVGRTPWTSDQPVARPLPTNRRTQTQNKRTQTSMPSVGLEHTIPAFERA